MVSDVYGLIPNLTYSCPPKALTGGGYHHVQTWNSLFVQAILLIFYNIGSTKSPYDG